MVLKFQDHITTKLCFHALVLLHRETFVLLSGNRWKLNHEVRRKLSTHEQSRTARVCSGATLLCGTDGLEMRKFVRVGWARHI